MNEKQIEEWYRNWCKETERGGGILIGHSIRELLLAFNNYLKLSYNS